MTNSADENSPPIRRALISVSSKDGLGDFARGLVAAGVELFSTGGTRKFIEGEGLPVRDVSAYTGFPEIMDGRVKTLHPKIHGGILCRHDREDDQRVLAEHGILTFELVVVSLYPFEATVARPDVTDEDAIENIDIGGPSLIRGAAKNHAFTTIVTGTEQYADVLAELKATGKTSYALRRRLAGAAYEHTARYDRAISNYFARELAEGPFPAVLNLVQERRATLRYGENPHQQAAWYVDPRAGSDTLAGAKQLNGKELSYNNLLDLDSALAIARSFGSPAVSVVKHNNPCGAAEHEQLAEALRRAMAGDPVSAFGSVLGFNRTLDRACAEQLAEPGLFVEAIVAPGFEPAAVEILTTKPKWKSNVRLLDVGPLEAQQAMLEYRSVAGGLLVQDRDVLADPEAEWQVVTQKQPTDAQLAELRFAWNLVRHVKSNAIVLTKDRALRGAGAGQMSRVDSVRIAIEKSGSLAKGAALGSDAFFPFPDSIEIAAAAGVTAFIQPGGSKNDADSIAACDQHGLVMIFTGRRHFKH
ncbi:MAG: bifunctional phosphoribosylaminoimidazolecarboxamide formyltransferase/IMP cyclohydrolase [Pirellulales bacterium]|nr:bifunctional phosphoribosylaminoimidazolecarboxamide formyltransferase/IMP cyclohydrolase [Pirellulales bacterium]